MKNTNLESRTIVVNKVDWSKAMRKCKKKGIKLSVVYRKLISMWLNDEIEVKF